MKELTIEEKAERYDKALERMKSWVRGEHPECFTEAQKAAEFIFPELKEEESEDEKIRKGIIRNLEYLMDRAEGFVKDELKERIAWLEKQGEPKPTDKVEPKFKVGDWISGYYTNYKVLSLNNDGYVVEDVDGDKINILFENEKFHHLFTIADAKDGDVLAISWWEDNNFGEKIIIFKKYHNKGIKGLYYMPCVEGYGNTFKNGKLAFNEKVPYYSKTWTCNLHPATKEQRDLLEKAMADAGYIFDFESKELKKLGQSEVTKMSDQEEIAEIPFGAKDSELQEATYFIPKGFHAEIDNDKVVIKKGEKLTAWSEEDEQITLSIEQVMNCASLLNIVPEKTDKIRTWLKSLKQRIGG